MSQMKKTGLEQIKSIIAVASGKGGVGKSTVATHLALALQKKGAQVGLLDADIYGPSQVRLLGSDQEVLKGEPIEPAQKYGLSFVSMGLLIQPEGALIWRAPMAVKVISQFLQNVVWGALDYLVIDLPPGTGDVSITLAQQAKLSGVVIVTTPQQLAIEVAQRGLVMFQQVNVPILGVVENMSGFICPHCQKETDIFNKEGGKALSEKLSVPFLGSIPLDRALMSASDGGEPVLLQNPEAVCSKAFFKIAQILEENLKKIQTQVMEPTAFAIDEGGNLRLRWPDGHEGLHRAYSLRLLCACAQCVDENTGKKLLDPTKILLDISVQEVFPVGRYALAIHFNDGHRTGIYAFERLRRICECRLCMKKKKKDQEQASFEV